MEMLVYCLSQGHGWVYLGAMSSGSKGQRYQTEMTSHFNVAAEIADKFQQQKKERESEMELLQRRVDFYSIALLNFARWHKMFHLKCLLGNCQIIISAVAMMLKTISNLFPDPGRRWH